MTAEDVDGDDPDLLGLLSEDLVRAILAATSEEARSASELAERCGVATSTVYRRIDQLRERDLIAERTRPKAAGGHETVYAATLERLELSVEDGEVAVSVDRYGEDAADRLTDLWGNF